MAVKIEKWVVAQKKHSLSDKHVQMARELGLNPDKLGKIDNHKQETWKAPLPQFVEEIYFKRFKREEPVNVRSLKQIIADDKAKKEKKEKEKAERRAQTERDNNEYEIALKECVVAAMGETDTEIFSFLPYILQDFWAMGSSPSDMIHLIEKHSTDYPKLKVLDLGCGKGAVSIKIAEKLNCECWGFDGIEDFINDANKKATEYGVHTLCHFERADIREKINELPQFDIIILGAIGQVFGSYQITLTKIKNCLKNGGLILIDDAYIEDTATFTHPEIIKRNELLAQISNAGMKLIDELIPKQDEQTKSYGQEFYLIERRCNELIKQFPEKKSLFDGYVQKQNDEYETLESKVVCLTMAIREV